MTNVVKFPDVGRDARLRRVVQSGLEFPEASDVAVQVASDLRSGVGDGPDDAQLRGMLVTMQMALLSSAVLSRAIKMNGLDYNEVWAEAHKSLLLGEGDKMDLEMFAKSIDLSPSIEGLS